MEFKYKEPDNSPGFLFWQLTVIWRRKINDILSTLNLTHTQYVIAAVTFYLSQFNEKTTQINISEFSGIDQMTMSKTIRLMEKKGLVKRTESKTDTRAKVIELSEEGRSILKRANVLVEQVDSQIFQLSEHDLDQFIGYLTELKKKNNLLEESK